jgi:hypothetical protein
VQDLGNVKSLADLAELESKNLDDELFKSLRPNHKRLVKRWMKEQQELREEGAESSTSATAPAVRTTTQLRACLSPAASGQFGASSSSVGAIIESGISSATCSYTRLSFIHPKFVDGPRVVLFIGINEYSGKLALSTCVADAEDKLDCCLHRLGFNVVFVLTNGKACKLEIMQHVRKLRGEFIKDGSLVVSFFSGHGCEKDGDNFLCPYGMASFSDDDLEEETVSINTIIKNLSNFTRS